MCVTVGCVLLSVYSGVMYLLTSALMPEVVVMTMQEWNVLFIITSRVGFTVSPPSFLSLFNMELVRSGLL